MSELTGGVRSAYNRLRNCLASCFTRGRPSEKPLDIYRDADRTAVEFKKALEFHQAGSLDEAEAIYRALAHKQPSHADVLHNVGVVQAQRGNFTAAAEWVDKAIALNPENAAFHVTRGNVCMGINGHREAIASYDKALAINPDFAVALNGRATALFRAGKYEEAVQGCDRALVAFPDSAELHFNRGIVLAFLKRHLEALASYDRAIALNPEYADAFNNRGIVQVELRRYDEALVSYDRALTIRPDFSDALNNRGGLLVQMRLYEKGAQDFSRLVELDPDYEYALGHKFFAKLYTCNWEFYSSDKEHLRRHLREGKRTVQPLALLAMTDDGADHLTCAGTFVVHACPPARKALWDGERYQHDRVRIAYLSADLREHAVAYLIADLIERHDKSRFEISAWSFRLDADDAMQGRLRNSFESFNDVAHLTDLEVATLMRAQEIDIVVDLMGFTQGSRTAILAHRPAPIQVNYLGYVSTMGASYMDYIIGDAEVIPVEHEAFYAEKVARLPDAYQVNDSKRVISAHTPSRAEVGLPEAGFVFCCFNNNYKITPSVFDIWMRLLGRVEGSVLWLIEGNAAVSRNLRLEAEARGISADRLVFANFALPPEYLARYRLADLFLDTLPYNAGTTASDALWVGLPVLTCTGNAFPGRMAASLLRAVGIPELITNSGADYEALAFILATTPELLEEFKSRLARNRTTHPLFDTDRFRQHIESAYTTMYERYQRGEPPQSFSVPPICESMCSPC